MNAPLIGTRLNFATPAIRKQRGPQTTMRRAYTAQGIGGHDDQRFYKADQVLADAIYAGLNFHYPDQLWRVEVSHKQGVALIRLMGLSDMPYVLKIEDLKVLSRGKQEVMRAGGTLLERFGMPRSGFKMAEFNNAVRKFKPYLNRRRNILTYT
jgi:hypothetical protein